jgi:hypothetical protein
MKRPSSPKPSADTVDRLRRHRAILPPFIGLHPYVVGSVEQIMLDPIMKPAAKVKAALEMFAALDIVEAEPMPEREADGA